LFYKFIMLSWNGTAIETGVWQLRGIVA